MYQQRDLPCPHLYGLGKALPVPDDDERCVTQVGQRECIHLSPALLAGRLRMCVATACRLTKNKYDSNAERHSSSGPGSVDRRPNRTCLGLCEDCCRSANDAQADFLNPEGERS